MPVSEHNLGLSQLASPPPLAMRLRVGLVLIGRKRLPNSLPKLANMVAAFNKEQGGPSARAFEFVAIDGFLQVSGALPVSHHSHENRTYFDVLVAAKLGYPGLTGLIGITSDELRENRFNTHDVAQSVGLVTIKDMEEVRPKGMDVEKYIGYLTLCESFCIAGHQNFEADDHLGCLFDRCDDKDTLRDCLGDPIIADKNATLILRAGFQQRHLDASRKLLDYIGKQRWIPPVSKELVVWAFGFTTGILVHITFSLWHDMHSIRWQKAIGVGLIVLLVVLSLLLKKYPNSSNVIGGH